MATFLQAPLRSRTVGFPESGSDLGFPPNAFPMRMKLKRWHAYTPIHDGLRWASSLLRGQDCPGTVSRIRPATAKCPEPLCPARVLPPPGWPPRPPRRALPLLHRSYGLMRQTKSLPPPSVFPRWRVLAGCYQPLLEDGPSRR